MNEQTVHLDRKPSLNTMMLMGISQTNFLSKSFEDALRPFLGRSVVMHNEFSANRIIRVVFSITGMSIKDRICVVAREVEVNEWMHHENVLMGPFENIETRQDAVHLTVESTTIVIRFDEISSVELTALPVGLSR